MVIRLLLAVLLVLLLPLDMALAAKKPVKPLENWQQPMKVVVVRSGQTGCEPNCPQWIMAEGEITRATPALFRKLIKKLGKQKLPVLISSPGGSIDGAIEIGRLLRKNGYDVAVGATFYDTCGPFTPGCKPPKDLKGVYVGRGAGFLAYCNSACPLVLAGGVNRYAPAAVSVGVHVIKTNWEKQVITYRETYRIVNGKKKVISRKEVGRKTVKRYDTEGISKAMRKTLAAYVTEMGVSPDIISDMEKVTYDKLFELTPERRMELKLVTSEDGSSLMLDAAVCGRADPAYYCVASTGGKSP